MRRNTQRRGKNPRVAPKKYATGGAVGKNYVLDSLDPEIHYRPGDGRRSSKKTKKVSRYNRGGKVGTRGVQRYAHGGGVRSHSLGGIRRYNRGGGVSGVRGSSKIRSVGDGLRFNYKAGLREEKFDYTIPRWDVPPGHNLVWLDVAADLVRDAGSVKTQPYLTKDKKRGRAPFACPQSSGPFITKDCRELNRTDDPDGDGYVGPTDPFRNKPWFGN